MKNIAEILKNAPQGLKLYSLVHGEVTLNEIILNNEYPVRTICSIGSPSTFTKHGKFIKDLEEDAECILFPSKEHKSWDNWQEVLFKPGDIITDGYVTTIYNGKYDNPNEYYYATPSEKEIYFKGLGVDDTKQMEKSLQQDKHKDCLGCVYTETKEESFTFDQLKPFDKVLIKYDYNSKWIWGIDLFERYDNDSKPRPYICLHSSYRQCIPYNDETKHLLGTTDDCPDKYKTWED